MSKSTHKKNATILIGNALEYYDAMLYGMFAASLAPLFFPNADPTISFVAAIGTYGIMFLARPLGGAVFGHFGDRLGRKNTFSLTLLLLALPTMGIALLPTYAAIGLWAPFLLMFFRFVQGFCLGGETSGAMTYMIENAADDQKDKYSAWIVGSCYVGVLVSTLLGAFFTMSFMPEWGWRITFAIGSLIALLGYVVRRNFDESHAFKKTQQAGEILNVPLKTLIKREKTRLLQSACVASAVVAPYFIIFVYLPGLLVKDHGWSASTMMTLNSFLIVVALALLSIGGVVAQKYGRERVMSLAVLIGGLCAYPLFYCISEFPSAEMIIITQFVLVASAMFYAGPTSAFLVELFPANRRYSGIAIGYALGHALFGGLISFIMTALAQAFGMSAAPAVFIIVGSLAGYWAVTRGKPVEEENPAFAPQAS